MKIQEILNKYNATPNSYYLSNDNPKLEQKKYVEEMMEKWGESRLPPNHYFYAPEYKSFVQKWKWKAVDSYDSFNLGCLFPILWINILDEFLEYVNCINPEFKIKKMSIKYGCLKLDLQNIDDKIKDEIIVLEENCWDEKIA